MSVKEDRREMLPNGGEHFTSGMADEISLPFIHRLVFAGFVFAVVLVITWGLYHVSGGLRVPWVVFLSRIISLAFLSFGTLWCAVSILSSAVEAVRKKVKCHSPVLVGEVKGEELRVHLGKIAEGFGEPWREHRVSLIVCSTIVLLALYGGISFAGLIQSNCEDLSLLSCELLCETGPDFAKPTDPKYAGTVLASYARYLEKKHLSVLLKVFPAYDPKQVIADVDQTLRSAKGSQREAASEVWQAGEELMLFRLNVPKLLPRGGALHEYREASELLLPLAKEALADSGKASEQFNNRPTMENAVHSCERNRVTILLLFPLRASYDKPEIAALFNRFEEIVGDCRKSKINIAGRLPEDDPRREFLAGIIARSEQRRLDVLHEIENRNMQEAIEQMWGAIRTACSERAKLLDLSERILDAGNYSEEIGDPSLVPHQQ